MDTADARPLALATRLRRRANDKHHSNRQAGVCWPLPAGLLIGVGAPCGGSGEGGERADAG